MPTADEVAIHVEEAAEVAEAIGGVVSRVSAAVTHGLAVAWLPPLPQVTVPRWRQRDRFDIGFALVRRMDLPASDVRGRLTTPGRTLIDCFRCLQPTEAIALGDSALRMGFDVRELQRLAETAKGPRSVKVRRIVNSLDVRSANVMESTLRAICLSVPGLHVEPQVRLGSEIFMGTPDLVDLRLRLIIEADSFEWHGHRTALVNDARRYNQFAADGWLVLRFTWEDIMLRQDETRRTIIKAVAEAELRRRTLRTTSLAG